MAFLCVLSIETWCEQIATAFQVNFKHAYLPSGDTNPGMLKASGARQCRLNYRATASSYVRSVARLYLAYSPSPLLGRVYVLDGCIAQVDSMGMFFEPEER